MDLCALEETKICRKRCTDIGNLVASPLFLYNSSNNFIFILDS